MSRAAERRGGRSRREEAERREAEGDAIVDHLESAPGGAATSDAPADSATSAGAGTAIGGEARVDGAGHAAPTPDAQQQDLARRRPELGATGTHRADAAPSGERDGGASSRRSLKQRGGIIGIVKRRFGRD